jgi:hypothetical protein
VWEDGRIDGGEEWQEKIYNREEWKKLLRTARNRRILHIPMNEYINKLFIIYTCCGFFLSRNRAKMSFTPQRKPEFTPCIFVKCGAGEGWRRSVRLIV